MNAGKADDVNIELENLSNGHGNGHTPTYDQLEEEEVFDDHVERGLLSSELKSRRRERAWHQVKNIVIESAPTLLLTAIGLLFTGELLDHVARWDAMRQVDQLIMIIPVILNLKGNLEMNLSARLGTAANVGDLDNPLIRREMILGNLALLQVQAAVVSFVAASVSLVLGLILPRTPPPPPQGSVSLLSVRRPRPSLPLYSSTRKSGLPTFIMVASTSMTAACLSSLLLGSFMCFLIVLCRSLGLDPDNIAPPVASCLGDLVTLLLMGLISSFLIHFEHTPVPFFIALLIILIALSCLVSTRKNPYVRDLVGQGWSPLFGAMIISSGTGIVLDLFVSRYEGFALLAVVISGLPGSVGSIFVSRLSTELHREEVVIAVSAGIRSGVAAAGPSTLREEDGEPSSPTPENTFLPTISTTPPKPTLVILTLLLTTVPIEIIFLTLLRLLGWLHLPLLFIGFSLLFFCCAVTISLFIARSLTYLLWKKKLDPDMYALPIHSALMDLVGQGLLVVCFEVVSLLGVKPTAKATTKTWKSTVR